MYVTVHSVKISGRLLPPGTEISISGAEERRLLTLGAIAEKMVPQQAAVAHRGAAPEGGGTKDAADVPASPKKGAAAKRK